MSKMKCLPEETLIIEDSPFGLLSANRANSHVMRVKSPKDITYDNIYKHLNNQVGMVPKWKNEKFKYPKKMLIAYLHV